MKSARISVLILLSFAMGSVSFAQEAVSPFVPPSKAKPTQVATTTPATALDSIEFNGVIEIGGVVQISLYDPNAKKSYWLTEKEAGEDGFSLVNYDAGKIRGEDRVLIRQGGVSKTLTLKDADIISLKEAPRPAPQRATQQAAPRVTPAARSNAPAASIQAASDEEVRERMQRVAEEIRRRRATRRDIIEDGSQK